MRAPASGGYGIDSHATHQREDLALPTPAPDTMPDGKLMGLEGFLSIPGQTVPYQLPYRIMVLAGIDGLLVPVAVSATHLGFGTIRMEPTWMALGEAAGTAAGLALQAGVRVRDVARPELQRRLLAHGQVITYFEDVSPRNFPGHEAQPGDRSAAVQFWGARGFFWRYQAEADSPLAMREALRWLWLVQRSIDPWRRLKADPTTFTGDEPITYQAL